jgi:YD repeat-containing protein
MTAIFTGLGAGFLRSSSNILGGAGQLGSASQGRSGEGVSVNAATGNLLISRQDEWLVGRGPDIGISRTYNSLAETSDGDNGDQWQQSTARRVFGLTGTQNAASSTIKRLSGDGSVITYAWNATKLAYLTTDGDGAHETLAKVGATWVWTDGSSQSTETYEADPVTAGSFRIKEHADTDGNKLTFTYLPSTSKLDKVTTADGAYTQYSWSENNITQIVTGYTDLATSTAKTLTRVRYTYDASNRLSTVTTDLSPGDNVITDGQTYVTTYTYTATTGKQIATIGQSDGSLLSINYESALATARVTSLTQTVASGDTRVTSFTYGTGFTTITGPDNQVTRLDYDAKKQLTKITAPPATAGATVQTILFTYDASGNVTKVTDAMAKETSFTYDANGNQLTKIDPNSNSITRTYGAKNELLTETMTGSDATGAAVAHTTRYAYDSENHLRYMVSAEGYVTEYYYNAEGQMYWQVEYPQAAYSLTGLTATTAITASSLDVWRTTFDNTQDQLTYNIFDARGNLARSIQYGKSGAAWGYGDTTEGYGDTYYTYDQAGQMLSTNKQGEVAETFVYDGLGRRIGSTDLNGGSTTIVFNDAATTTTITAANGQITTSTYNKAGDMISQILGSDWSPSAASTYKYDKLGRLRQMTDAAGGNFYYLYDKAGRKTAEINHYGWITEYQYDANNRVVGEGRYTGAITAAYLAAIADPNNALDIATIRPAAGQYDIWSWSVYDNGGRIVEKIDGTGGATRFEYDRSDRLIKTTSYFNKLTTTQVDGFKVTPPTALTVPTASSTKDNITRNFYDNDGRLIGSLDALGYLTEIIYDKAGQKIETVAYAAKTTSATSATDSFNTLRGTVVPTSSANTRTRNVYDGQGLLRYSINAQGNVSSFTYNTASKLTTTTQYAASIATTTTNYSFGNIKTLVTAIANATNDRVSSLTYDASGRVATSTDAAGLVTSFTYDNRGQVIKTVIGSGADARITRNYYTQRGELRFSVDAEGYVTEQNFDTEGRALNKIQYNTKAVLSDSSYIGDVSAAVAADYANGRCVINSYNYYANGETVYSSIDATGVETVYERWANGMMYGIYSAYGTPDQTLMVYLHDGAGRVTSEYGANGETEGTLVQYEFDGQGNRTKMIDANGKVTTYTYDKLGQMLTMTDAAGGVTSYQYNAFGQVVKVTDPRNYASYNYYDTLGRLTLNRDAENYLTETSYTLFGEVASVTRRYTRTTTAASVTVIPTTTANAKDATTSFVYDKRGLVTRSTDAEGFFQSYTYDALGQRISSTAKSSTTAAVAGGTTTYTYDKRGQMLSETLPFGSYDNSGTLVSATVTNSYSYDARGNRTQMIEAAGLSEARTTSYAYDKNNRLIETRLPVIRVDTASGANVNQDRIELIKYDARGNIIKTVDSIGAVTVFFYDDLNRKVVEINAVGTYTAYTYDKVGNVTNVKVYGTAVSLPATGGAKAAAPGAPTGEYRETVFTYDNINRMLTSAVTGVNSYIFDGTNYVLQASSLATAYQYDANGNVVKLTDANGKATFSYYDKLGRKTAQVDAGNYLTSWTYDSESNVLIEKRSATQAAAPVVGTIPAVVADAVNDRTTTYIYDRNGNRIRETRSVVLVHNGSGGATSVGAAINYLYNGLGQVVRKTEATGDQINYIYDAGGRLSRERRAAFTAFDTSVVTPTVDYFYNGIGNLSRTVASGAGDAAARVTTYQYGNGGVLEWVQDASGQKTHYSHDVAGRQIGTRVEHKRSDGTTNLSSFILSYRDNLGRVNLQTSYYYDYTPGKGWDWGVGTSTTYNAYGDVASVYLGGASQAENKYDSGGRLIASNSGDGIWKHFGYDANGNQTVAIASAGANLTGQTFTQALGLVGQANVNATYTLYDARNLATSILEEGRQLSATAALQTLTTSRSYNGFGEVIAETNALGATVNYTYNTMGRLIKSESPLVSITAENGAVSNIRPTENYYYDAGGRLVASRDANGNLNKLTLLAGTGYGGGQAQVLTETHADGGVKISGFDIHGDLRKITDEISRVSTQSFDAMGRVTQITHAGGLIDYYAYDGLGQQVRHWNNQLGIYDIETSDYDTQGRVISARSFGGDVTTTSYSWNAGIATPGLGTFGAWTSVTTFANGRTMTEVSDAFDRTTSKTDLGGRVTSYTYDTAGRMTSASTGGLASNYNYLNTGLIARIYQVTVSQTNITEFVNDFPEAGIYGYEEVIGVSTTTTNSGADYTYNAVGNRVAEYGSAVSNSVNTFTNGNPTTTSSFTNVWKNQSATYDVLGRLKTWQEVGATISPAANIAYEYDANGNIRRTLATNPVLDSYGNVSSNQTKDYWFRFDSMNRLVTDKGRLSGAVGAAGTGIVRGYGAYFGSSSGQDILYNAAGERAAVLTTGYSAGAYGDNEGQTFDGSFYENRESYIYDIAGRLTQIQESTGAPVYETYFGSGIPSGTIPSALVTGTPRSYFGYDLMGRQTSQSDYQYGVSVYSRTAVFNSKGQLTSDFTSSTKGSDTYTSSTTYDYGYGANYALGQVISATAKNYKNNNDGNAPDTLTTNGYVWWDGAVQSSITYDGDTGSGSNPVYNTNYYYDGQGRLTSATINDYLTRYVTFTNDELGQIIRRDETRPYYAPSAQTGSPHEVWYRFAGRQLGYTGNNGTSEVSTAASIAERQTQSPTPANTGTFRNGSIYGSSYADFAQSYDPLNSYNQGSGSGSYVVRSGDTLQTIAQNLYGDGNLWYKIAEANGLSAGASLIEGRSLNLPAGVAKNSYNTDTFRPYDPQEAIGDLSPTNAKPPKKPKCGVVGQILMAAIAIAVATLLTPVAAGFLSALGPVGAGIAGGAVAGAAGSAASQVVGVATGIQEKFSFKGVAMAALAGGVGGAFQGIGKVASEATKALSAGSKLGTLTKIGNFLGGTGFASSVVRAGLSSALTQGIAKVTGLQDKFSWAGVAASAVGAGVGSLVGGGLPGLKGGDNSLSNHLAHLGKGAASAIANAVTRSALSKENFGNNLIAAIPDVIGQAIFDALRNGISLPKTQVDETPGGGGGASTVGEKAEETLIDGYGKKGKKGNVKSNKTFEDGEKRIRPANLYGKSGRPLQSDAIQGSFADCYFIATLAALAKTRPDVIKDAITYSSETENFTVKFYIDGKAKFVSVNQDELRDNIKRDGAGKITSLQNIDGAAWPTVVETAYAKLHDKNPLNGLEFGYKQIEWNFPKKAFRELTGQSPTDIIFNGNLNNTGAEIFSSVSSGKPSLLMTKPALDGLVDRHVYMIESISKSKSGNDYLLKIRNVWGHNNDGEGTPSSAPTTTISLKSLISKGGFVSATVGK